WDSRPGLWTLAGMTRRTGFTPPGHYLGNPAAAVPTRFTADGLARSVHRVRAPLARQAPSGLLVRQPAGGNGAPVGLSYWWRPGETKGPGTAPALQRSTRRTR